MSAPKQGVAGCGSPRGSGRAHGDALVASRVGSLPLSGFTTGVSPVDRSSLSSPFSSRGASGGVIPWYRVGSPPLLEGVSPGSVLLGLIVLPLSQFDSSRWLLRPPPELPRPGTVLWRRVGVCSFPLVPPSPEVDGDGDHCLPFLTHRPSTRECWTSAT